MQLNQTAAFRPLAGMPSRVMGPAVLADRDMGPVIEALELLGRSSGGTSEEREAIRDLTAEYLKAKDRYGGLKPGSGVTDAGRS